MKLKASPYAHKMKYILHNKAWIKEMIHIIMMIPPVSQYYRSVSNHNQTVRKVDAYIKLDLNQDIPVEWPSRNLDNETYDPKRMVFVSHSHPPLNCPQSCRYATTKTERRTAVMESAISS